MLILTIKAGTVVKIGENIEVVLCSTKGQKASIGISAPQEIRIRRDEPRKDAA
jgi:carbon storage regulator CsrA